MPDLKDLIERVEAKAVEHVKIWLFGYSTNPEERRRAAAECFQIAASLRALSQGGG